MTNEGLLLDVAGAAAVSPEAAGATSGGIWARPTASAARKHTQPGGQTATGPGSQGPSGAETKHKLQIRSEAFLLVPTL